MPLIEFICPKCGEVSEELTKADGAAPACPKCGEKMQQKYWGKCYVNVNKSEHCSGNCATCKGCGK